MTTQPDSTSPPDRPDGAAPDTDGDPADVTDPTETEHPTGEARAEQNADDEPVA